MLKIKSKTTVLLVVTAEETFTILDEKHRCHQTNSYRTNEAYVKHIGPRGLLKGRLCLLYEVIVPNV